MQLHRYGIAVFFTHGGFIGGYGGAVFTVSGNDHRRVGEDAVQSGTVIHQHIAGRGAHKDFYTTGLVGIETFNLFQVIVGGAEIESKVGQ